MYKNPLVYIKDKVTDITIIANAHKTLLLSALLLTLTACATSTPYKAYFGDPRRDIQLATAQGDSFIRVEMLNRCLDTIRFIEVADMPVINSDQHRSIQITPGFHDIKVYFSWDLGSQRGLAPAMVDYSKKRENISRTFHFNARAGESYSVMANPVFDDSRHNITILSYMDFWVENEEGAEIGFMEAGRFPQQQ